MTIPTEFSKPATTFYWIAPGDSREVTYSYKLDNGEIGSRSTTFNVIGPTSGFISTKLGVIDIGKCDNSDNICLRFGIAKSLLAEFEHGINFGISIQKSSAISGNIELVQLIVSDDATTKLHAGGLKCTGVGLDTTHPYPEAPDPLERKFLQTAHDSPQVVLKESYTELTKAMSARMYLMWRSSDRPSAIPVPLGFVDWQWSAHAVHDDASGTWKLQASSKNAFPYQSNITYPNWTNKVPPDKCDNFK